MRLVDCAPQLSGRCRSSDHGYRWPFAHQAECEAGAVALGRSNVRRTLNLKFLSAVTISRFALMAGEGARVPSINRLVSRWETFCASRYD